MTRFKSRWSNPFKAGYAAGIRFAEAKKAEPQERIIAAAINMGAVISLPPPARHPTIIQTMDLQMNMDGTLAMPFTQGFLTDRGRFVNRVEAYYLAYRAGQIKGDKPTPTLYSEDLW